MTNKFLLIFSVLLMIPFIAGQAHAGKPDGESVIAQSQEEADPGPSGDNGDSVESSADQDDSADVTPEPTYEETPSSEPTANEPSATEPSTSSEGNGSAE